MSEKVEKFLFDGEEMIKISIFPEGGTVGDMKNNEAKNLMLEMIERHKKFVDDFPEVEE